MRIWIVNHYAVPPTLSGGTRHYCMAQELIGRGHEVEIVAANFSHFSRSYMTNDDQDGSCSYQNSVRFRWIDVPPYKGNTFKRLWNTIMFGWRVFRLKSIQPNSRPDVIIGSSPHLFAAFASARLAKKWNIPFISEIRDIWPDSLVELGRIGKNHPLIIVMKWVERYIYRHSSKIIVLLPNAEKYLSQFGVSEKNVIWFPNFVDKKPKFIDSKSTFDNKFFTVMYAGAHGLANDLDTVISAAKILQKNGLDFIRICLIGEGPEKDRLKKMAQDQNITNVIFKDAVAKDKVYSVLSEADVFLIHLKRSPVFRWGVSPNKLFDYFYMSRPVIFGIETPIDPVKISGAGISIPPEDPSALANTIKYLAELTEEERIQMGQKGKVYLDNYHDLSKLVDSLENLLTDSVVYQQ